MPALTGYAALLRGINVGGHRKIKMTDVAAFFSAQGFESVRTYLQSGNVTFAAKKRSPASLAAELEAAFNKRFAVDVSVIVRTCSDLRAVVDGNPFLGQSSDPKHLHVTFLSGKPADNPDLTPDGEDAATLAGAHVYLHCPGGYGKTKLNNTYLERKLRVRATTRNWNTVSALAEMCG